MISRLTLLPLLLSMGVAIAGASTLKINFQSNGAPIPDGYLPDYGAVFGDQGNGWSYGWDVDNTANARDRNNIGALDQRYDTVNHFRLVNVDLVDRVWEIALPNGTYNVFIVCGDPSYIDHVNTLDVEGRVVQDPDGQDNYDQYWVNVEVTDGRLTIQPATGSGNSKICFVDITSDLLTAFFLKATAPDPADGAEAVVFSFGRRTPPGATAALQWSPGDTAVLHDVYFDTTPDLGPDDLVSAGQASTLYWHLEAIESGTTYFWRVDEVESDGVTIHEGDVWSFTTLSTLAWKAQPADGSENVLPDVFLNWRPGSASVPLEHALYFGENFVDVNEGIVAVDRGIFKKPGYSAGMLEADTTYYWRVDELEPDGTVRRGDIWRFTTASAGPGGILREWWFGIDGKVVASLTSDPRYPSYPDGREFVSCMQSPSNWADQYGVRLRGWLFVPKTGFYTFLVEAKDEGWLLLSSDDDPAHAAVIVTTPVVLAECPPNWAVSAPQSLEAGKRYYIEALMKEGTINDQLIVSWEGSDMPMQIIKADYLGPTPYLPACAYGPSPSNGAVDMEQDAILTWHAGEKAALHDVYFGQDPNAVAAGLDSVYCGRHAASQFDPGMLDWGVTYYWRVDEVNPVETESPWVGPVWSFATADFLTVDHFEDYDHDIEAGTTITQTWNDGGVNGSGSMIDLHETTCGLSEELPFVHSLSQSMLFIYDNSILPGYSEVSREWPQPQDWTVHGGTDLVIWYRSEVAESQVDQACYVTVLDAMGRHATVTHPHASAIHVDEWTAWRTPLNDFAEVDPTQIKKLAIGVGDPVTPTLSDKGCLYIDDICVMRPAPMETSDRQVAR